MNGNPTVYEEPRNAVPYNWNINLRSYLEVREFVYYNIM